MNYENIKQLADKWGEMTTRVRRMEEISYLELHEIFGEVYRTFAALCKEELVPRETCQLILNMDEFETYATMLDETPVNKIYPGIYHLVKALKYGFLNGIFQSEFVKLKVTTEGVQIIETPDEKKMYILDMEKGSIEDFIGFLTGIIGDEYDGLKLVGYRLNV